MTYKTEVDGGYAAGYLFLSMFTIAFCYAAIKTLALGTCVLAGIFLFMQFVVITPMYLNTRYILEEDGLRIRVGLIANRFVSYDLIYGFQRVTNDAQDHYGLSGKKKIAIFYSGPKDEYYALTISPKQDEEFIAAFTEKTDIEITPPARTFREVQDEYNAKTSDAQRKLARKRLASALRGNYDEFLASESPESLQEQKEAYEAEMAAEREAEERFNAMTEEEQEAETAREKKATFLGKNKQKEKARQDANDRREGMLLLEKLEAMKQEFNMPAEDAAPDDAEHETEPSEKE